MTPLTIYGLPHDTSIWSRHPMVLVAQIYPGPDHVRVDLILEDVQPPRVVDLARSPQSEPDLELWCFSAPPAGLIDGIPGAEEAQIIEEPDAPSDEPCWLAKVWVRGAP